MIADEGTVRCGSSDCRSITRKGRARIVGVIGVTLLVLIVFVLGRSMLVLGGDPPLSARPESQAGVAAVHESPIDEVAPPGLRVQATNGFSVGVRVVNPDGVPLPGAVVAALVEGKDPDSISVETNSEGLVELGLDAGRSVDLLVSRHRYFTTALHVPAPLPSRVECRLEPCGSICGSVRTRSGLSAAQITVLATEWPRWPHVERPVADREGRSMLYQAATDTTGRFCIDQLNPHDAYRLTWGGAGFLQVGQLPGIRPDTGERTLEVARLYGVLIRFRNNDNSPAAVGDPSRQAFKAWCEDAHARVQAPGIRTFLAGAPSLDVAASDAAFPLLVTHDLEPPFVTGIRFAAQFAGFEPITVEATARPISDGMESLDVILRQTTAGWGAMTVVFEAPETAEPGSAALLVPEECVVGLEDDTGGVTFFPLMVDDSGTYTVDQVPFGAYRWELKSIRSRFSFPPPGSAEEVEIRPDHVPAVVVPTSGLGALALDLMDERGSPYHKGAFAVIGTSCTEDARSGGITIDDALPYSWDHPPYVIRGLHPGEYSVLMRDPRFLTLEGTAIGTARVIPGRTASIQLHLQDS